MSNHSFHKLILELTKLRLSLLVVFSAIIGYAIGAAADHSFSLATAAIVAIGGFLVTGGSNGLNQYLERSLDAKMDRTAGRPLPQQRMSPSSALIVSLIMGLGGVVMLGLCTNPLTGVLSLVSLLLYVLAYTPLKQRTPFSVFVGAIPGAMPVLLGWVAARNSIGVEAYLLYAIQFIWQFPHFWSIAWLLDDDYKKAGFIMLPTGKRDKSSAFQTMVYTLCLIPMAFVVLQFNYSWMASLLLFICGVIFSLPALKLYKQLEMQDARKLMFGSFVYLPVVQLVMLFDKLLMH
ncbi:MAG: protoheme farnesyltransferase [Bacteroidota bacterium]